MSNKEKFIYKVSRAIGKEQLREALNEVSEGQLATKEYLAGLDFAPNISDFPPYCSIRYK